MKIIINYKNLITGITFSDIQTLSFFLLLLFPVLPILSNNGFVAIVFLLSLIGIFFKPKGIIHFHKVKSLILLSIFLILAVSLLYSDNLKLGVKMLEIRAAFVFFTIIFLLRNSPISTKFIRAFELAFIFLIFAFFTYINIKVFLLLDSLIKQSNEIANWKEAINYEYFYYSYRVTFEKLSNIHPTYASIYSLFSSGLLIMKLLPGNKNKLGKNIAFSFLLALLLIFSILLSAKGPLLAFVISMIVVFFIQLKTKHLLVISGLCILFLTLSVTIYSPLRYRVNEVFQSDITNKENTVSIRKIIFHCSITKIMENKWLGVGLGNTSSALVDCYSGLNREQMEERNYNTHNEYFNLWLTAGILGVLLLLLTLALPLYDGIKQKDIYLIFFILFVSICLLFENVLSRQKGVLFFTLFYIVYYFHLLDNQFSDQKHKDKIKK